MISFPNMTLLGIAVAIAGLGAGYFTVTIFNKMPANWLVDYGETPDEELVNGKRLGFRKLGILISFVYAIILTLMIIQYGFNLYPLLLFIPCIILLLIGISDKKYMIIPDQLVVALGIFGALVYAFEMYQINVPFTSPSYFHFTYYSPLLGALIGGGTIFAIGFIGSFLLKKEAMGFGDVKLLAAVGVLLGTYGIIIVLIMTVLISGIYFIILMLAKKLKRGDYQALGPFIVASSILYLALYDKVNYLVYLYMSQF
jgi:prepilin signal peptidase PulO-like enzyme (type II secretory pathway)